MSLTAVRPYFRARAKTFGWKEWLEPFHDDNIPSTLVDKSFHMKMRPATSSKTAMVDTEMNTGIEVKYYRKGFRDPASGLDEATLDAENFIKECLKSSNRCTQPGLKNVTVQNVDWSSLGDNSNLIVITMQFSCLIILDTN